MEKLILEQKIASTNSWGLIAMLLSKLMDNFEKIISLIKEEDYNKLEELNNHSRAILTELLVQFNGDDELSLGLREVLIYINKSITQGEIEGKISIYEACIEVVRSLLDGFKELEVREEPKTIRGLTYGKNNLNEHVIKSNSSFKG